MGRSLSFYQDWLVHEQPEDPWWDPVDFSVELSRVPPASLVGGWYDVFLPAQIADFVALRAAGRQARLTSDPGPTPAWRARAPNCGTGSTGSSGSTSIYRGGARPGPIPGCASSSRVSGGGSTWTAGRLPPPPSDGISTATGVWPARSRAPSDPDRFRYDPAEPTPGLGGPSLNWRTSGPRDQAVREQRPDVLTYTSDSLTRDLTVAGPLDAEIWFRSSAPSTDVFVRLCDVDGDGLSTNVSDGILRVLPGEGERDHDGTIRVRVSMWPTATTFVAGHRLRLQVSSGAHPLFARNPGSDQRLGSATTLVVADQTILHDPGHPSAIELPVSTI